MQKTIHPFRGVGLIPLIFFFGKIVTSKFIKDIKEGR